MNRIQRKIILYAELDQSQSIKKVIRQMFIGQITV